jgi:hypothetical protein
MPDETYDVLVTTPRLTTPRLKRYKISASIRMYKKKIAQARAPVAHVAATKRL